MEIDEKNRCIGIIETKAEKDYGLKFYALDGKQKIVYGIYQLNVFTITDLYYLAQVKSSYLNEKDFNNYMATVPKIEFKFIDQELVQTNHSIFTEPGVLIKPVDKINREIVDLSKTYFSTIEMMIDDLVPMTYYNTLNHRTQITQVKTPKQAKECEDLLLEFKERFVNVTYERIYHKLENDDQWGKIKKRIKKYEKKTKKKAIKSNRSSYANEYSREFLDYYRRDINELNFYLELIEIVQNSPSIRTLARVISFKIIKSEYKYFDRDFFKEPIMLRILGSSCG